ncbi:hypothetical protein [Clostridium sp.]|uniref:hypothetical protein n=1 Tax=Clostridium sp. TaxID=1506 RepID=UPI0026202678|nr:hypothetical protein [Clostridium sp.]
MSYITKVIIIASIGFIIMGITYLKSQKIKNSLKESELYKDSDRFIKFNGIFNISIGSIGILVGIINNFIPESSRIIAIIFSGVIIILSIIQNVYSKKYKK